jgi:hypothetical protein
MYKESANIRDLIYIGKYKVRTDEQNTLGINLL